MRVARRWLGGLVVGLTVAGAPQQGVAQQDSAAAQDSARSLEQRIDELDQQVRILQRLRELAADSIATGAKDRQSATANSKDGFSLKSADGNFQLRLRGYVQADGRFFVSDSAAPATSALLIRRARPILEATVWKYFDFRVMPDFASTPILTDAYVDARVRPAFVLRAGKFKPPLGLERLQSATDLIFVERGLPTNLVPNRDLGLEAYGDIGGGLFTYAAGVFNGAPDLANVDTEVGDQKDVVGRVFVNPLKTSTGFLSGLSVGVAASTGIERGTATATALPAYRTPGQQTAFRYRVDPAGVAAATVLANGTRSRLVPQATFYSGPLGIQGEYAISWQEVSLASTVAKLRHQAWQVAGSYFLTGERNAYRTPTPKHPLYDVKEGKGGSGAVELAARYGELTPDADAFPTFVNPASSVQKARAWAAGINWHFARGVKLMLDYEHTTFDGGASAGDRESENVVLTRVQHSF